MRHGAYPVKIHAAKSIDSGVLPSKLSQEGQGMRVGQESAIVSLVPHFDAVDAQGERWGDPVGVPPRMGDDSDTP